MRHLKREHPEQMHYIISELEVGIGAVFIAVDSGMCKSARHEELGVACFVYGCTILYAIAILVSTLQYVIALRVLCDHVSATQEKQILHHVFSAVHAPKVAP